MPPRKMKYSASLLAILFFTSAILSVPALSQRPGSAARFYEMAQEIDSLQTTVVDLNKKLYRTDSLYKAEKFTTAELRDQLLTMDQDQKSLEATKTNIEDKNLKLNQSNRILIIFNSVVAALLVVTLVFVIKRAGRKQQAPNTITTSKPVDNGTNHSNKLASFEDKLARLEKLGELKEKGILSDDEFQDEKQRILGR
jgi:hypothetical protein